MFANDTKADKGVHAAQVAKPKGSLTASLCLTNTRRQPAGIRSPKEEYLSKIIFFGEGSLRRALHEYVAHYHSERNHQGKSNVLLFPRITETRGEGRVRCRERLGGLLRYYHQDAA